MKQAQVLKIKKKDRNMQLSSPSSCKFETLEIGTIDAVEILNNPKISLYFLKDTKKQAIFVELSEKIDLSKVPFFYQAQYEYAVNFIVVSYETLHWLAEQLDNDSMNLVSIFSIGRCGSTLLSKLFNQVSSVISFSEPDLFTELVGSYDLNSVDGDSSELIKLFRSSIKLLCKRNSSEQENLTWVLKFRSSGSNTPATLIPKAFPQAKSMFLYRNAETWAKSYYRMMKKIGYASIEAQRRAKSERLNSYPPVGKYEFKIGRSISFPEYIAFYWAWKLEIYLSLRKQGISIHAIRYDELVNKREESAKEVFKYCGIPSDQISLALKAFEEDSQAGSMLSQSAMKGGKENEMTEEQLEEIRSFLQTYPVIQSSNFIVPGCLVTP